MKKTSFLIIFSALCLFAGNKAAAQELPKLRYTDKNGNVISLSKTVTNETSLTAGNEDEHIFNISRKCVFKWDGTKWIDLCLESNIASPSPDVSPCVVTASDGGKTFTAKTDPNAEAYEFFVSGSSRGVHGDKSITFDEDKTTGSVTVKYYYLPSFLTPKMIDVEGSDSWKSVNIPNFKMSETEVTQAQFEYVTGKNESHFKCGNNYENSYANNGNATSALPVEGVNWYQAIAYCNKLSVLEGKDICYTIENLTTPDAWANLNYNDIPTLTTNNTDWDAVVCDFSKNGYRLPTETEWEYAARGGNKRQSNVQPQGTDYTYAGSNDICDVAWYTGNTVTKTDYNDDCAGDYKNVYGTKPVAQKETNELDLYDMSGNLWEWCWEWHGGSFPASTPDGQVQLSSSTYRILRGGSWETADTADNFMHVSYRGAAQPYYRHTYIGIRIVCTASE
ncbi:MAG: formylglycine-generating enzyme family protein [Dysgonamonadaceae bacterium]|jgi:formylglycine-generating enzyme required for sulfatase activity|nr:formylglycine-generating enzyme family protein [Dysgonamonadaceae bacterium]